MRYVWPAVLIMVFASACSSGSTAKRTPSAAPSKTAGATGSTTPLATPSVAAASGKSPTPAIGTAIAVGTVTPIAAVGVDPAAAQQIGASVIRQIEDLNAGKFDELYDLYSTCAKKKLTKDQLAFGKTAIGRLTLLGVTVVSANDRTAVVQIETQSLIYVGNQNHFKSKTSFVHEDGSWKIDPTPAECGR